MASARRVLRDERLPICAVCGDRREPSGSACKAHEKGAHHRANAVLTRRAHAGWCPLTDQLLSVLKRCGVDCEIDGHWIDKDLYRRSHRIDLAWVRVEDLESFVEDSGDAALAYAVRAGWGPWMLAATRFAQSTLLPWWIAVRATDPQAPRWSGDASAYRNLPLGVIRGRPWPRPWHPGVRIDAEMQAELSIFEASR